MKEAGNILRVVKDTSGNRRDLERLLMSEKIELKSSFINVMFFPQMQIKKSFGGNCYKVLSLLIALFLFSNSYSASYVANGSGTWENSSMWTAAPDAGTLGGTISWGSVDVTGTILRTGTLNVGNTLTVKAGGVLTVNGNVTGNNPITVNNGGILYITGDLISSGMSITIDNGGRLVVLGNTTLSGGNVNLNGDFITLGNFSMTSIGATINNNGNLVVGGNFNFGGGSLTLTPGASASNPVNSEIYFINPNATISQIASSPICTTTDPICGYGNAANLLSNDPALATYLSGIIGCILAQPVSAVAGCTGSALSINITTNGTGLTYQWQVSINGGSTWSNVPAVLPYSGATTATLSISSPTLSMTGFKFKCIVGGGCTATSSIATLTVNSPPAITSQPASFCGFGTSAVYSVVATGTGLTYQWQKSTDGITFSNVVADWAYTGVTAATMNAAGFRESGTTYYRCVVTSNGCSVYSGTAVLSAGAPSAAGAITGSSTVCSGATGIAYTVPSITGAASYTWAYSGTGATITGTTQSVTISFSAAATGGNLTVKGVNACGTGTVSANFPITINTPVLSSTLTPAAICSSGTFSYTATSAATGATFAWTRAAVAGISNLAGSGASGVISEVLTNTTTAPIVVTYQITTTASTCSNTQNVTVTVNPTPVVSSSLTPAAICSGATFSYTATSATTGATFAWTRAAVAGISNLAGSGSSGVISEVLANTTTAPIVVTYKVTTTANTCANTQNVTVTVNPTPVVSSSLTPAAICSGATFGYTATSATTGATFAWTRAVVAGISNLAGSGATGVISEVLINTTTAPIVVTYKLTTTANTCANTQNVTVTVNPIPVLSSTLTPTFICSNTAFSYTPTSAYSGATFGWTRAAVAGISNTAASGTNNPNETLINTTTAAIVVTYVYTTTAGGCSNAQNVTVTVKPRPTSVITGTTAVCNGSLATISVALTGTSGWGLTYSDGSSSIPVTGIGSSPYTFNVASTAKTYTITVLTDGSGCTSLAGDMTGSAAITVKARPTSVVSGTASLCKGSSANLSIAFTGTSPWALTYTDGTTPVSATGITANPYTPTVTPVVNATYTVSALSDASCVALASDRTGSAVITMNSRPTSVISTTAAGICNGSGKSLSIALTGSGPWDITYSDGTTPVTATNINTNPFIVTVYPTSTKTYTVTALHDQKCAAIAADMTGSALVTVYNPATASVLTGTATICSGSSTNLNVAITGGTSPYKVILSDAVTTSGYLSGGNISKTLSASTTYTLTSVQDANGCYSAGLSGSAVVTVKTAPATPSVITPASPLACKSSTVVYSVVNDPAVSIYAWSYTGTGATLTPSGNSVSIDFNATATSGTLTVTASNGCTPNAVKTLAVTVNPNITPTVSIVATPAGAVCSGSTVTYKATPVNGGTPTYQWYLNGSAVGTNANTWSENNDLSSDVVTCKVTSSLCSVAGTNPATSNSLTSTKNKDVINLTSVSGTALCAGTTVNVNFTTPCDFVNVPVHSFKAQLSNASGSFASPVTIGTVTGFAAGTYVISATIPMATVTGTGYLIRVISSNAPTTGISGSSAAITISSNSGTPIAATTYGSGVWNVFCYSGNSGFGIASGATSPGAVNTYLGYYTENNLSFDSRTRWGSGTSPITANTTTGSVYIGCTSMPASNIYMSFKRTGIPCGNYRIDIPFHDDAYELYIDGALKASHNGCCDVHTGVWTGWIGPTNLVEFRLFQGTGGSGLQATFVPTNLLSVSPNVTVCSGAATTLVATGGGSTVTYSWTPSAFLNTPSGATVISTPTASTVYTVSAADISSGCATTANVAVTVSPTITLAVTAVPVITTCMGVTSTTLTATGANTYSWSPAAGLSATTGSSVVASPGINTTYTITGNNGCINATKTIAVAGQTPATIDTSLFSTGAWTVLCHDTTNYTKLFGYYTDAGTSPNGLSFNTSTKWNTTNGPSVANASYTGCTMPGTYYSLRFKRTGVPCGYYTLTVNYQDDAASFWIDGVRVWYNDAATGTVQANVWTGFIGPSSKLEFRLINYASSGRLQVTFTPITGIPNLSTPTTVCAGTSTTLTTGTLTGASYTWSSSVGDNAWISPVSGVSTVVTPPSLTPNGGHYFVRTITDGTTACSIKDSVLVTVNPLANTTVTPADTTVYCPSATVKLIASGASTYSWSPALGLSATTGGVVNATPGVTTTYTVSGNNNCNTKDVTAKVTVVPLVADNTFPTGKWNVYGYNSTTWTNYMGFYTTNGSGTTGYDFDTRTQWGLALGPANATATGGTAYSGCTFGVDNFTTSFKRTGFTCGFYQIDMVFQDDAAELWIDGVKVWANATYTATEQTNIWSCFLSSTSTVEFRQKEGGGGAGLAVRFTAKTPTFTSITVSPVAGICASGSTSATLTTAATGVGNTYTWTPVAGLSATTGATTTALPAVTTKYHVRVSNCGGTVYGDTAITVIVIQPSIVNTHPIAHSVCENGNTSFTITSSNTTIYQWEVYPNGGAWTSIVDGGIYSGASTQTLSLTAVTFANNNYKYRCRTSNGLCSTAYSNDALLTVNQVPVNPAAIAGVPTVCQNTAGFAFSVPAVSLATSYAWTLPAGATIATGAGTNSITVDFASTSGNVSVVGTNGCGNSAVPSSFAVTVNTAVPAIPGVIAGPSSVCINSTGLTYSVPAIAGASGYSWTVPSGATITGGINTNTITVSYGAAAITGSVTVAGVNPCGSGPVAALPVTVNSLVPGNPVVITGTTTICSGNSSAYSLGVVTGATSYTWTAPSGSTVTSGAGTNNATILFGTTSGTIYGVGTNGCGNSAIPATLVVTVSNPLVTAPGIITGTNSVCKDDINIAYSVPALAGSDAYIWTVPSGASITSGSTTNSIIASYGASAVSGNVTVSGTNICGSSPAATLAVAVNSGIPNNTGSITGSGIVCTSALGVGYSIGTVTGATSYSWTLPAGATIASGAGSNNITVNFGTTPGNIKVTGVNGCGSSPTSSTFAVTMVSAAPSQPSAFTASTASVCQGSSNVTYTVPNDINAVSYTWSYTGTGASFTSTSNTVSITFGASATSGTLSVTANNACASSVARSLFVSISPTSVGGSVTGGTPVCSGSVSTLLTLSGYTGSISKWQSSTDGVLWTDISNTANTFTSSVLTQTTQFRAVVTSGVCTSASSAATTVVVTPLPATGPLYRKPNN